MANQTQDILGFPLAPQQEQLFLLPAGVPATQAIVLVADSVSEAELQSALDQLVSRYEILRTTFGRRAGMRVPQQVISDELPVAWTTDTSGELDALFREESVALDVERGPVLRAALTTLASSKRALVLTAPAACLDGASMTKLLDELARLVAGNAEVEEPLQYADYAEWRRQLLDDEGPDAKAARTWWGQDDGRRAPQLLFGHPAGEGRARTRLPFTFSDAQAAAIRAAAGRLRVSDALFVEACLHALVSRISGESELSWRGSSTGATSPTWRARSDRSPSTFRSAPGSSRQRPLRSSSTRCGEHVRTRRAGRTTPPRSSCHSGRARRSASPRTTTRSKATSTRPAAFSA